MNINDPNNRYQVFEKYIRSIIRLKPAAAKLNVFALLWSLVACVQLQGQSSLDSILDHRYPPEHLLKDIEVLRSGLEKLHPSLYRHTPKDSLDALFGEVEEDMRSSKSYSEFYRKICWIVAKVKCQHTVAAPQSSTLSALVKKGKFFPLKLLWEFEPLNVYVSSDMSFDPALVPGTKIISINGRTVADIYASLIPYFSSDGDILTNKHSRLQVGVDFQFWYAMLMDRSERFVVKMENTDGQTIKRSYAAVTFKDWRKNFKKYRKSKNPLIREYIDHYIKIEKKDRSKPVRSKTIFKGVALLRVGNFDTPLFEDRISEAFKKINGGDIEHLIVDVRNNGGGSDIFGRYLFSHLIDRPTVYFDSLYTSSGISDTTFLFKYTDKNKMWYAQNRQLVDKMPSGRYATKPEVNKGLRTQRSSGNSFSGEIYVLMNGRSASTTAEFTAAMHMNGRATFIGEESGGAYHGGNGGDFAELRLPNSKIVVTVPLVKYVMNSREPDFMRRGTLPDFNVPSTMEHYLKLEDPQLNFALEMIRKKSGKE